MEIYINYTNLTIFINEKIDEFGELLYSTGTGYIDFVEDPIIRCKLETMQKFINELITMRSKYSDADFKIFPGIINKEIKKELS
jgi:hypothetical protein